MGNLLAQTKQRTNRLRSSTPVAERSSLTQVSTIAEHKPDFLSTVDIFQDLSFNEVAAISRQLKIRICPLGHIFYIPGEIYEMLFLLKEGRVQLYRLSPNGRKLVVATLGAGAVFGEESLIGEGMHNTFAQAMDECTLWVMRRDHAKRLVLAKPQVALRFLQLMGKRLQETERLMEEISFKNIPTRLASLLLRLSDEQGCNSVKGYTHQSLGEMLGTYRETTTQTLSVFKAHGLLEISRMYIELIDRDELAQIAHGNRKKRQTTMYFYNRRTRTQ